MQWLQEANQSKSNVNNLNNVRCEASRHVSNTKKEYLRAKIDELETNSKIKIIREFIGASVILRRVTNLNKYVQDDKGDVVRDSHSVNG